MRTDDSVLRSVDPALRAEPMLLRRSRGYVPRSVDLPFEAPRPLLGCGAELKNTFCVAKGAAPGSATTSATSRTTRR